MMGFPDGPGAIELRNVSKTFGSIRAVDGVSLQVESGEFLTLLGPSGCGKSTTLKLIAGFESLDSGDVLLAGRSLGGTPPHKRPVHTVFQDYALFPHLSIEQNIMFGLRMAGVPQTERQARADAATTLVRLETGDRRKPHQLSGGQQQRVALARALANRPSVLLLDEPLGALDLKLRSEMQRELRQLNRRLGTTFIYVTHDQDEALTMSDRIAVMNRGRVLQVGTPTQIYEQPRTRFVADFVGQTNLLTGTFGGCRDGQAEIEIGGIGTLLATPPVETQPVRGDEVALAVRPEKIAIGQAESQVPGINSMSGTVVELLYRGSHVQVMVEAANGAHLTVQVPSGSGASLTMHGGETVALSFAVSDAAVLLD